MSTNSLPLQLQGFNELFNATFDSVFILDQKFGIYKMNKVAQEMFAFETFKPYQFSFLDLFMDEEKAKLSKALITLKNSSQLVDPIELQTKNLPFKIVLKGQKLTIKDSLYFIITLQPQNEHTSLIKMLNFFARATKNIGSSLEYNETQEKILNFVVPAFADWCSIQFLDDTGNLLEKVTAAEETFLYLSDFPHENSPYGIRNTMKTGISVRIETLSKDDLSLLCQNHNLEQKLIEFNLLSYMCIPLIHRNTLLGTFCLLNRKPFLAEDQVIAEELAARFAIALDNSKLYEDLKLATDEVRFAKYSAEIANRAKSEFLANMSHEIRTPLGAILGFVELLLEKEKTDPESQMWGQKIKSNGAHLLHIIDEILDLSKIESGKIRIEIQNTDLVQVITDVASAITPQASSKELDFQFILKSAIPQFIYTDPVRLRQILINIIGNAIKFTEKGSVTIHINYNEQTCVLDFEVKDTGIGLTEEQAQKLFQPFSQGDASHSRQFGGTGLGLSLSRSLAQQLGGNVILKESSYNKGTSFKVSVHAKSENPKNKISTLPQIFKLDNNKYAFSDAKAENFSHLKILLIEDYVDNQILIKHYLKNTKARLELASDGEEGLKAALNGKFDLILLDIQMPKLDGYEVCQTLRETGLSIPIIALTAHALKEEKEKCLQAGFSDHLSKPLEQSALIQMIKQHSV